MLKWEDEGQVVRSDDPVKYVFSVGDRVETKHVWFFRWFTRRGTVTSCSEEQLGLPKIVPGNPSYIICCRRPVYQVRLDCDGKDHMFKQNEMSF